MLDRSGLGVDPLKNDVESFHLVRRRLAVGHVDLLEFLVGRGLGQSGLQFLEFSLEGRQFTKLPDEQVSFRFDHPAGEASIDV